MKELSLNILDIAENSLKAASTLTEIKVSERETPSKYKLPITERV